MNKKFIKVLLSVMVMITMMPFTSFADTGELLTLEELREEHGALTIEAYNIGQGFLVEPSLYTKDGSSVGDITVDVLESKNIEYKGSTSYFSGLEFDDTVEAVYPEYLEPYAYDFSDTGDGDGYLSEFDYSYYSGWCYSINDWWASLGADSSYPGGTVTDYNTGEDIVLGDVIRWHYTVAGYGADCGFSSNVMAEWMGGNLFRQEDKTDLIFILAAINDYYGNLSTDDVYETALDVAANPLATIDEIENQKEILISYIENTYFSVNKEYKITGCDAWNVYLTFVEEGTSTSVIFADYENKKVNSIKPILVVTEKTNGENTMAVPVPSGINLSVGDKIMLWDDFTKYIPLCEEYVIGE